MTVAGQGVASGPATPTEEGEEKVEKVEATATKAAYQLFGKARATRATRQSTKRGIFIAQSNAVGACEIFAVNNAA